MGIAIDFYLDPVSPYAWLASEQLERIERAGARIRCRPVLLAALLDAHATSGPAEVPAKRAYVFRDVMRQAARLGLPFRGPPAHPFNPLAALRAALAIDDEETRLDFCRALLSAVWRDGADATAPDTLAALVERSGVDPGPVLDAVQTDAIKDRLREATRTAIETGVFGVPTFRLGDELFWGADRIDAVIWALEGGRIDEAAYAEVIDRPSAASRI